MQANSQRSNDRVILTRDQVRAVDRFAIEQLGIPGIVLMENAGRGCVDELNKLAPFAGAIVLCGAGNNAGDGFVIARHLAIHGIAVKCALASPIEKLPPDARCNYEIARRLQGVSWLDLSDRASPLEILALLDATQPCDWIIDALLGTGSAGKLRSPFLEMVQWANQKPSYRMAVDIPTGVECDSGEVSGVAFRADLTCTFVAIKPGLANGKGVEYAGKLAVVDIGIPDHEVHKAVQHFDSSNELT